jgi:hypothetical protein
MGYDHEPRLGTGGAVGKAHGDAGQILIRRYRDEETTPVHDAFVSVAQARGHPDLDRPDLQVFPSGLLPGDDGPELTLLVALLRPALRGELRPSATERTPTIELGLLDDPDDPSRLVRGRGDGQSGITRRWRRPRS